MQLSLSIDCIDNSKHLACLDLITSLYRHASKLAIEREIVSMLYKHALIVSRHCNHLLNNSVKYRLYLSTFGNGDIHTIVRRQFEILIDRMIVLSETSHYRSVYRPWKLTFVLRELSIQLHIDRNLSL